MKIGISSDHRGYQLKTKLIKYLQKKGYEVEDFGTDSEVSVDYPTYGFLIGEKVANKDVDFGIAICGSGIGISIACNKVKGVRCAKVSNVREARYARVDNDANVVAISATMPYLRALDVIDTFLKTKHLMVERHDRRINMITEYENKPRKRVSRRINIEETDNEC